MFTFSHRETLGTPESISCCFPIGKVSDKMWRELLDLEPNWKIVPGRAYQTWYCLEKLRETKNLFERWHNAFLINLPPTGKLHKHTDTKEAYKTFHVPIVTNYRCFNCFELDGKNVSLHMEAGLVYEFDRTVPHWAVNAGKTDRIHLMCEVFV
jgi:aspartyl/asparaginyl beta-hydroxylase (cupin superfamily)